MVLGHPDPQVIYHLHGNEIGVPWFEVPSVKCEIEGGASCLKGRKESISCETGAR